MSTRRTWNMPDDAHISLSNDEEKTFWTQTFGIGTEELQNAVNAVGHSAANVRAWLEQRGHMFEDDLV